MERGRVNRKQDLCRPGSEETHDNVNKESSITAFCVKVFFASFSSFNVVTRRRVGNAQL